MELSEPASAHPEHSSGFHDDHCSSSHGREHVADPSGREAALRTLSRGPRGAAVVASIALSLVLLLWLLFYLLVFLPRGPVE